MSDSFAPPVEPGQPGQVTEIGVEELAELRAKAAAADQAPAAPAAPAVEDVYGPPPDPTHVAVLADGSSVEYSGAHPTHAGDAGLPVIAVYPKA